MAPIDDETLDRLLTSHLSARLDGQLGRAEPAFRRRLAAAADAGVTAADSASGAATNAVAPLRLVRPGSDDDDLTNDGEATPTLQLPARTEASPPHAWHAPRHVPPPHQAARSRQPAWARQPGGWLWAAAGAAMAAAVAAVFVLPNAGPTPGNNSVGTNGRLADTRPANPAAPGRPPGQPMVRYIHNRTWDEGTYAPGGSAAPVRRFRHQQVEHVRFYDADRGAWVELTVPHEDVEQFELDTY